MKLLGTVCLNFQGKLEDGETPEDTARIETKEEAGIDVEIVKRIPSTC